MVFLEFFLVVGVRVCSGDDRYRDPCCCSPFECDVSGKSSAQSTVARKSQVC